MSWVSKPDEIAAYAVASRFSQTVLVAIIAVLTVMAPYLAEMRGSLRSGDTLEIKRLVQQTARTILLITILLLLF